VIALAELSESSLDVAAHLAAVADAGAGATAVFVGTVRDHDPEASGTVERLEYSAHPDAPSALRRLVERFDAAGVRIAVTHRLGSLAVGDVAVVCAVSSAHRAGAFDICRNVMEALKTDLPVWKKQIGTDGRSGWVGLGEITS